MLCQALVPTLKQFSLTLCPWDLLEFGGRAQSVAHGQPGVADGGPGRCFVEPKLLEETIAYYQTASHAFKRGELHAPPIGAPGITLAPSATD